jgi:hypothetical protein
MAGQGQGVGFALQAWMWFVPIAMLVASVTFGVIAAVNGNWGLLAIMFVMGLLAIGMMVFHWWLLYRFGATPGANK